MVMECSCCGNYCPPMKQWYNRDIGYSICRNCINNRPNWFDTNSHGIEGIHYESQEQYDNRISKLNNPLKQA